MFWSYGGKTLGGGFRPPPGPDRVKGARGSADLKISTSALLSLNHHHHNFSNIVVFSETKEMICESVNLKRVVYN